MISSDLNTTSIEKYKGGFCVRGKHPIESVEWLMDDKRSREGFLFLQAYDANLYPLPNYSEWNDTQHKRKMIPEILERTKDFTGEIWLDDVKIK